MPLEGPGYLLVRARSEPSPLYESYECGTYEDIGTFTGNVPLDDSALGLPDDLTHALRSWSLSRPPNGFTSRPELRKHVEQGLVAAQRLAGNLGPSWAVRLLPWEAFGRLVIDLARERVVRTPWALIAGELCVNASLNWGSVSGQTCWDRPAVGTLLRSDDVPEEFQDNDPPPWGDSHEQARLLARDDAILNVLPALQQAPYGNEDVAVVFDSLGFGNRAILDHFRFSDHRTTLVCFALTHSQVRPLATNDSASPGGPVHPVRTAIVHTFKHAAEDGAVPAITSVAARPFGPSLVSGETWG
ncbi:hypothetical protein [Streptomyces sp. NPDC048650]|uniref:hypothetical protein n=1 Tax=unclassified Streptomyces TaxID=2593676 RepID=UPI00371A3305